MPTLQDTSQPPSEPKARHYLTVEPFDPESEYGDHFTIDHPDSCEKVPIQGMDGAVFGEMYNCGVEYHINEMGLEWFFLHADDPETEERKDSYSYAATLKPGRYEIEVWTERYDHWEYGPEWDSGLRVVECEQCGGTGKVECWNPGGPCPKPNDPECETCGPCNLCTAQETL